MVYVGVEFGDDEVLVWVNKGEIYFFILDVLEKFGEVGISCLVMIFNGLGGMILSVQYVDNFVCLMNVVQLEYLLILVVSFFIGEQCFCVGFVDFEVLDWCVLFVEVECLLQGLEFEDMVFCSDYVFNYLVFKGELGVDKVCLLVEVCQVIEQLQYVVLCQEWQCGL